MTRCKACGRILWTKGGSVKVVTARPADDAGSLMLAGEEELAISTLNNLGRYVEASDIRSGIVACERCWKETLEPPQRAEIDNKLAALRSATEETPCVELMPLGNLTAEYYASQLADLLVETTDRNVKGWVLFCAANRLQNYSHEMDEICRNILLPKVSAMTSDRDYDVARAAKLVLKAFDGDLAHGEWSVWTNSWTGFKKLP